MQSGAWTMESNKEDIKRLIKRIDKILQDGLLDDKEFQEFEILLLESLRLILKTLSKE